MKKKTVIWYILLLLWLFFSRHFYAHLSHSTLLLLLIHNFSFISKDMCRLRTTGYKMTRDRKQIFAGMIKMLLKCTRSSYWIQPKAIFSSCLQWEMEPTFLNHSKVLEGRYSWNWILHLLWQNISSFNNKIHIDFYLNVNAIRVRESCIS